MKVYFRNTVTNFLKKLFPTMTRVEIKLFIMSDEFAVIPIAYKQRCDLVNFCEVKLKDRKSVV